MKLTCILALLLSSFVGCNINSTPEFATLTIKSPQKKELNFSLTKLKFNLDVESITLEEGKLNFDGSIKLSIPLVHPVFIKSTVDEDDYYIYLEPGFNLIYELPQNSKEKYGLFYGVGADENSYLQRSNTFWQECYNQIGNYIFSGTTKYGKFLDSTSTALSEFNSIQLKNKDFGDHTLEIFNTRNEAKLVSMKSQFKFVHPLLLEQSDSVPKSFKNMFLKLPFNKKYLNYGMENYFYSLDFYNRFEIIAPLNIEAKESDEKLSYVPILSVQKIKESQKNKDIEEFLLAKNIGFWLAEKGITSAIDSIYDGFKREYQNSEYLTPLEKKYSEFFALTSGQPAPEITGVTISGDTITLSSLKGKVVYVDVWATWCGPCIAEFPYYTSIQDKFNGNKEIIFLFVSKDSEKDKWKDYVESKMKVTGIQLFEVEADTHPSLSSSYKLWGIPHYILIDKDGNIAINKAPRPSSGKVIKEIAKLL